MSKRFEINESRKARIAFILLIFSVLCELSLWISFNTLRSRQNFAGDRCQRISLNENGCVLNVNSSKYTAQIFKGTVMIFLRCVHMVSFIIFANVLKQLCGAFYQIIV